MTSVKAAAAIAVVVIVVCAVAAYAVLNDDKGSDSPTWSGAIGNTVEIGDSYTLESASSGGAPVTTTYEVVGLIDDTVIVNETVSGVTNTTQDSVSGFLDDVMVSEPTGIYQRSETLSTWMGDVTCDIYFSEVAAGNATTVSTYDWIGRGTNIIYRTEITIESGLTTETYTTTLTNTNMIGSTSGVDIPQAPSISSAVRTDLVRGDYIEYTEYKGNWREDVQRYTVLSVEGDRVLYTDDDDFDWDDARWGTPEIFVSILVYSGTGAPDRTETVDTAFGSVRCDVYEQSRYPGFDWDESITLYVGQSDGVIYRFVVSEWGDRDEVYELTGTSLFLDAPGTGGGQGGETGPVDPGTATNAYGVELAVGDYYVTQDSDDRHSETKEIIAIENGRLIVMETSGNRSEVERMSANDFLDDIMVTQGQLDRMTPGGSETVNGVQCQTYTYRDDGDTVTIYVDSRNVVWQKVEPEGWFGSDTENLVELGIASLN